MEQNGVKKTKRMRVTPENTKTVQQVKKAVEELFDLPRSFLIQLATISEKDHSMTYAFVFAITFLFSLPCMRFLWC